MTRATISHIIQSPIAGPIAGSSDMTGLERITIIFGMRPNLYDVLSVVTYALLRFYIGAEHAWPVVALMCAVCAADRDMDIHEVVSAVYMLRFACRTDSITGTPAYCACLVAGALSLGSSATGYTDLSHVYRRVCLFVAVVLSVMVRYPWNADAHMSVCRLLAYTLCTRYMVGSLGRDPWDAAVQCMWLLALPMYTYALIMYPVGVYVASLAAAPRWVATDMV